MFTYVLQIGAIEISKNQNNMPKEYCNTSLRKTYKIWIRQSVFIFRPVRTENWVGFSFAVRGVSQRLCGAANAQPAGHKTDRLVLSRCVVYDGELLTAGWLLLMMYEVRITKGTSYWQLTSDNIPSRCSVCFLYSPLRYSAFQPVVFVSSIRQKAIRRVWRVCVRSSFYCRSSARPHVLVVLTEGPGIPSSRNVRRLRRWRLDGYATHRNWHVAWHRRLSAAERVRLPAEVPLGRRQWCG